MIKKEVYNLALRKHLEAKGKLAIVSKIPIKNKNDLAIAYTPGVSSVSTRIAQYPKEVYTYTSKQNSVAVVTDGSAVLGLGNIGPEASLPVMEGKVVLFKRFANIDAFPICIKSQNPKEIINTVQNIAPTFGGINLEDISAPRCFMIEEALQNLGIPVMHDDQHGTAVVVLAALLNALKLKKQDIKKTKIVINGAGAAGIAIAKILLAYKPEDIILCDSQGIIYRTRTHNMNPYKRKIARQTNKTNLKGILSDAMKKTDVFIGVSAPNIVSAEMIRSMNPKPIVFAMANPEPEIHPKVAQKAGASIIGTGRSDYPNQINNVLAFPGIFRGALDSRAVRITEKMKLAAAHALASSIKATPNKILPSPFDKGYVENIRKAVMQSKIKSG